MSKPVKRARPRPARREQIARWWAALGHRGHIVVWGAAVLAVLGLATMFTATQFENQNSFCASCHTEGEQTFYNQSLVSAPVDLASEHEIKGQARCIDCHTGPGAIGRFGGLMAGASDLVSYFSGHYPQPAIQDNPISDNNCLKCHANLFDKQDMNNHFHVFLPKWQAVDPKAATCVSCHNGHNTKGDAQISFLNQNDTSAVCQQCHAVAGGG